MKELKSDDSSGSGNNFKIIYGVTAGNTYYFGAKFYDNSGGFFDVSLTEAPLWAHNSGELTRYYGTESAIAIPAELDGETITSIASWALSHCTSLTSVTIPDNVTSISGGAFSNCTALTSVTIGKGITWIGYEAFYDCPGLTSVMIQGSRSDTEIGMDAFGYYDYGYIKVDGFTIYGFAGSDAQRYAEENGFDFIEIHVESVVDQNTGISAELYSADDLELSVETVDAADIQVVVDGADMIAAYDIKLLKGAVSVQPIGTVTVKIPCANPNAKVYRMEADGKLTDMNAKYQDGYLVFTTDHFSIYIVATDAEKPELLLGDVDGDDTILILDATCIQRHLASIPTFAYNEDVADTDLDGSISIIDATYIQRWLASLPTNDKIGKPISK